MAFDTPVTLSGPTRAPRQMLADQSYDGHASVHDGATADALGLRGAPIEGPTHFSQFDPLAYRLWGRQWFEQGCISSHFTSMVIEGEQVTASLTTSSPTSARIVAHKPDGTQVLIGSATVGPDDETELGARLARLGDPGELFIVDQLSVGRRSKTATTSIDMNTPNSELYPFSLRDKLDAITEPSPWYDSSDNPWGRPIVPIEMISVMSGKAGGHFTARGPSVGLFIDLEVRLVNGPVFVDQQYSLDREVVGLGQSKRTESYWVRTTFTDIDTGLVAATMLLHSGVFKASYAGYPTQ